MVFLYVICFVVCGFSGELSAAASSSSSSKGSGLAFSGSSNADSHDVVVAVNQLSQSSQRGSRLRRGMSTVRLDLTLVPGLRQEHYDEARNQIASQLNQVGLCTPRTDRSKHVLLEQIGKEINRQKAVLADSGPINESSSDDSLDLSSDDTLNNEELENLVKSQAIANTLLTQMIVRQQDDREQAEQSVKSAVFRANVEAVLAVVGTLAGVAGVIITIVVL